MTASGCADCGGAWDVYMVHDALWRSSGYAPEQVACMGCLERRLGRALTADDLTDAPASDVLRVRLGGALTPDRAALRRIAAIVDALGPDGDADAALDEIAMALEEAGIREIPGEDVDG